MLGMIGCTIPSDKEIYQSSRNEVLKVQDRVKEIIGDEVLIGSIARLNILNDYLPTSLLVFDMNGNYIRTLDVGYKMMDFCIDEDNNRAIFAFSDEIQFGYLDLEKLIFR
jgi:hypothetical protein